MWPCRAIAPVFERATQELEPRTRFVVYAAAEPGLARNSAFSETLVTSSISGAPDDAEIPPAKGNTTWIPRKSEQAALGSVLTTSEVPGRLALSTQTPAG